MKLKICGMKHNTTQVATLQPDYLGFIFYDKSPRHFEGVIPDLPNSIKKVGVFVDATLNDVMSTIKKHQLHAVQLHGNESPEYCKTLKERYAECQFEGSREQNEDVDLNKSEILNQVKHDKKLKIIKVFSINNEFNFEVLQPYEAVCDFFLFDTKGKHPGGNGYTFNWNVLKDYPSTKPYFLSGGIGLEETEKLNDFFKSSASEYCYAVDVNSKFELKPGLKNIDKLIQFKKQMSY